MNRPLRLNMIRPGEKVLVVEIRGGGPLRQRLVEMGVLKGTQISVQRFAPLGDPMEIRLKGYSLSIRKRDAHHIVVERDGSR